MLLPYILKELVSVKTLTTAVPVKEKVNGNLQPLGAHPERKTS